MRWTKCYIIQMGYLLFLWYFKKFIFLNLYILPVFTILSKQKYAKWQKNINKTQ